jgi:tRNA(adenine34) deaminase
MGSKVEAGPVQSPRETGESPLTADERWMRRALDLAYEAKNAGEVPVGAVLVSQDGQEVAAGWNRPISTNDPTAHAEMIAIREAGLRLGNYRLGSTTLYVTLEPCPMCAGALVHARVSRLVFGARDLRFGGVRSKFQIADSDLLNHQLQITEGVLGADCQALLQEFFAALRK